jgi:hypothetical protein
MRIKSARLYQLSYEGRPCSSFIRLPELFWHQVPYASGYVVSSSVYRERFDGVGVAGIEPAVRKAPDLQSGPTTRWFTPIKPA